MHIHERDDEYLYVLEGRMGALLGDKVVSADEGDFVFKPRNQWHVPERGRDPVPNPRDH